jgi:antirestriction protein ArdC
MSTKVVEIVTSRIIESLNQNDVPWIKPWSFKGQKGQHLPFNVASGKRYNGTNCFLLSWFSNQSPVFGTLKQWQAKGERIKYDQFKKSIPIVFYKVDTKVVDGVERDSFMIRFYSVYNETQLESWNGQSKYWNQPESTEVVEESMGSIESVENFFSTMPVKCPINEIGGDRAFYSPIIDAITLPKREQFTSLANFYATKFHEIGHATGHESRLARKGITEPNYFGSHGYSMEELVAEIYAFSQLTMLGVDTTGIIDNTVAYCQGWSKVLKKDPSMVLKASSLAFKAIQFMNPDMVESTEEVEEAEEA